MVTAARDRLARTLRGNAETAFSVELTTRTEDLDLAVAGFGPVRLPVTPAKARKTLRAFLSDQARRTFEWPIAQQRRQHIHSRIDAADLPVSHVTRRQGRPYTLILAKTDALFALEQEARIRDQSDLEWLTAKLTPGAQSESYRQ